VMTRRYSPVLPTAKRDGHGLIPRILELGPGQAWGSDGFCLPEYRHNRASIRKNREIGREPLYYVEYSRWGFYERLRVSKDIPGDLWPARQ
jgi:hypothetical protein